MWQRRWSVGKPTKLSDRDKNWFKRRSRVGVRVFRTWETRKRIHIVCEGSKIEPNYFEAIKENLPPNLAEVKIDGTGANTLSLVQKALQLRDQQSDNYPVDEVWGVFDRDSCPPAHFDNAIHMAEAAGLKCAWSNEAF